MDEEQVYCNGLLTVYCNELLTVYRNGLLTVDCNVLLTVYCNVLLTVYCNVLLTIYCNVLLTIYCNVLLTISYLFLASSLFSITLSTPRNATNTNCTKQKCSVDVISYSTNVSSLIFKINCVKRRHNVQN